MVCYLKICQTVIITDWCASLFLNALYQLRPCFGLSHLLRLTGRGLTGVYITSNIWERAFSYFKRKLSAWKEFSVAGKIEPTCYLFLLSSRLFIEFLCQLLWRLYCNSLTRPAAEVGTVWETEGLRERDNKSYWDLKGKRGRIRRKRIVLFTEKGAKQLLRWSQFHMPAAPQCMHTLVISKFLSPLAWLMATCERLTRHSAAHSIRTTGTESHSAQLERKHLFRIA